MAQTIQDKGKYKAPSGQDVEYPFEFLEFSSIQDAVASLTDAKVLKLINRMSKVDANNTTREKAKVVNGHSTRVEMTAEQKAEAKAQRAVQKNIMDILKAKGIDLANIKSIDDLTEAL